MDGRSRRAISKSAMATFPITREFLGTLVARYRRDDHSQHRYQSSTTSPFVAGCARAVQKSVAPPVNTVRFSDLWGGSNLATNWTDPLKTETEWLNMRTRPSAVLRTVLAQKVDFVERDNTHVLLRRSDPIFDAEGIALVDWCVSVTQTITGAVHELYEGTVRVMKGDLQHRIPLGGKDQLGELAVSFNQMTRTWSACSSSRRSGSGCRPNWKSPAKFRTSSIRRSCPMSSPCSLRQLQPGAYGIGRLLRLSAIGEYERRHRRRRCCRKGNLGSAADGYDPVLVPRAASRVSRISCRSRTGKLPSVGFDVPRGIPSEPAAIRRYCP